jgi:hypothetical protein
LDYIQLFDLDLLLNNAAFDDNKAMESLTVINYKRETILTITFMTFTTPPPPPPTTTTTTTTPTTTTTREKFGMKLFLIFLYYVFE